MCHFNHTYVRRHVMEHNCTRLKFGLLSLFIAGSALYTAQTHALYRHGYYFDDLWHELDSWHEHMDLMREHSIRMQDLHKAYMKDIQNIAQEHQMERIVFPRVKTDISQDDTSVVITLAFEHQEGDKMAPEVINQKDVDVHLEGKALIVTLPVKHGKIELVVDRSTLKIIKSASIQSEKVTDSADAKALEKSTPKQKMQLRSYTSSITMQCLPSLVEINKETAAKVKALVKDNVLTLVLPKKTQVKIPVTTGSHAIEQTLTGQNLDK